MEFAHLNEVTLTTELLRDILNQSHEVVQLAWKNVYNRYEGPSSVVTQRFDLPPITSVMFDPRKQVLHIQFIGPEHRLEGAELPKLSLVPKETVLGPILEEN